LEFYSNVVDSKNFNHVHPNGLSFNLVIKALCRLGLIDQAVEVFRGISVRNCVPDNYRYSTLMHGLCNLWCLKVNI
jgi:pentatricopeptide repeat protein